MPVFGVIYWIFMTFVPFGDSIAGTLEPGNNFAAWIDQYITPGRMYWSLKRTSAAGSPEGFFSTIPAIASGISSPVNVL